MNMAKITEKVYVLISKNVAIQDIISNNLYNLFNSTRFGVYTIRSSRRI
jgi:hypothetical protein